MEKTEKQKKHRGQKVETREEHTVTKKKNRKHISRKARNTERILGKQRNEHKGENKKQRKTKITKEEKE